MTVIAAEEAGAADRVQDPVADQAQPQPPTPSEPSSSESAVSESAVSEAAIPPQAAAEPAPEAPEAEPDAERGKTRRSRRTVRGKSAGGAKALVVWREGRVQYADDGVLVVDLDEAASADTDVHDVVDRLTELREALDSPGRAEAVAALAEIIQDKALS